MGLTEILLESSKSDKSNLNRLVKLIGNETYVYRFLEQLADEPLGDYITEEAETNGENPIMAIMNAVIELLNKPATEGGLKVPAKVELYRILFLKDINDLRERFGDHWTPDPRNFRESRFFYSFKDSPSPHDLDNSNAVILRAMVRREYIDWESSIVARFSYPDEEEITLLNDITSSKPIKFNSVQVYRYQDFYDEKPPIKSY